MESTIALLVPELNAARRRIEHLACENGALHHDRDELRAASKGVLDASFYGRSILRVVPG
jgi:hypothetical protein